MKLEDGSTQNTLFTGDNLFVLNGMNSNSVDLIYLDPPFNSKRMYSAPIGSKAAGASFKDTWTWLDVNDGYLENLVENHPFLVKFIQSIEGTYNDGMMAYITYMTQRILEMHRILKDTGSFYLHCDPTASHYLKQLLDYIFGKSNFRNEIVWHYNKWTNSAKYFQRNHDIILCYAKNAENVFFDKIYDKPTQRQLQIRELGYNTGSNKGRQIVRVYDKNNSTVITKLESGDWSNRDIYYVDSPLGNPVSDVWDIPYINSQSKERTGYPTQKPLALLHRIIKASSKEGDIVFDPFCGCATTCVAAQQLGRKWIGIDIEQNAVSVLVDRLSENTEQMNGMFADFINLTTPPQRTDIQVIEISNKGVKQKLFKEQNGGCKGCGLEFNIQNFEVDHIVPKAKGGGDYYENYQLLCSSCNRIKGARPMEYLRIKIKRRMEEIKSKITFGE